MPDRRRFLSGSAALAAVPFACGAAQSQTAGAIATRLIPSTGERIPAVGMGSWLTFDVGESAHERRVRTDVLRHFFEAGGTLVDSSPVYGSSQAVIGHCLRALEAGGRVFGASSVWTPGRWLGERQMGRSMALWGLARMDLMQVHNLLDSDAHLKTLRAWKDEGRVRYIGVTTSHGRRHDALESLMRAEPLDFVQLTYNIADRDAEQRLLPLAADRGIAVIANRPFRRSRLFDPVRDAPLPLWARDLDCENWAQLFLKFVISHPAVTCAIPATSRVDHMIENMGALTGRMPNRAQRLAMAVHYASL